MPARLTSVMYFRCPETYAETEIHGVKVYRNKHVPVGAWIPLPEHPIDRLLDHIHFLTDAPNRLILLERLHIQSACVSRLRRKEDGTVPLDWFVKMSDYSNLPLKCLYEIGGLSASVPSFDEYHQRR